MYLLYGLGIANSSVRKYFDENKDNEYIPANALFDDYNILFVNHSIVFRTQEAENE